jgi:hypothetical protein
MPESRSSYENKYRYAGFGGLIMTNAATVLYSISATGKERPLPILFIALNIIASVMSAAYICTTATPQRLEEQGPVAAPNPIFLDPVPAQLDGVNAQGRDIEAQINPLIQV